MDRRNSSARGAGSLGSNAGLLTDLVERMGGGPADTAEPDDVDLVISAALAANLSEFDLFRVAWRRWTGADGDPSRLDQVFARYLHEQTVPGWVRHFARQVVDAAAAKTLDRATLGLDGYARREPLPDLSCRLTAEVLGCLLLAMIVILI